MPLRECPIQEMLILISDWIIDKESPQKLKMFNLFI